MSRSCSLPVWGRLALTGALLVGLAGLVPEAAAVPTVIATNTALLEGTHTYDELTLENGCTLTVAGGSTLAVTGSLLIRENSALLVGGKDASAQVGGQWVGVGVTINAGSVTVETGSRISADAQGYTTSCGPGGGGAYSVGGTHGGAGGNNHAPSYGVSAAPVDLGSGGGGAYGGWSRGGGAIRLSVSGTLTLAGEISADGQSAGGNNGGAAGGSVWITTDVLVGAGLITAVGNAGQLTTGGGGRIAVYSRDSSAFSGFTTATAAGGGLAGTGTAGFWDTGGAAPRLSVYEAFVIDPEAALNFDRLTLDDAALLTVSGGSTLEVTGTLTVRGSSTLFLGAKDTSAQVGGQWVGVGVTINAATVTVEAGSVISADGQGYATGCGPGGGGAYSVGGTHGGAGSGNSAPTYGVAAAPVALGSAGGGAYGGSSRGGGAIRLSVGGTLTLDGQISADGQSSGGNNGGGAGGSVWVTTDTLAGAGPITATGNPGLNGVGGGGRIAVYYREGSGFTGFAAATAAAGGAPAKVGSLCFFDTSVPGTHLTLTQNYAFDPDAAPVLGGLTLTHGATLTLGGGSVLTVAGDLVLAEGSSITALSKNRSVKVLAAWVGVGVTLRARNLSVAAGCRISADGQGYTTSAGPAAGGHYNAGGSYGGPGGRNSAPLYGDAANPVDLGSGGGAAYGGWSYGGGAIRVYVTDTFTLDGDLTANGQAEGGNHAGGAGGSVFVNTSTLAGSGLITANGASASYASGGGGRVAVYIGLVQTLPPANIRAWGGWHEVQPEGDGTVVVSTTPLLVLTAPAGALLHGTEAVAWEGLALDAATHAVAVTAADVHYRIGQGLPVIGSTVWDTTAVPDGVHELRIVFTNAAGQLRGELSRSVLVNNALGWHSGRIVADETWGADRIHIIDRDLTIAAGVRITVAPGAIVKVVPRVGITVEAGGVFDTRGSAGASIVLTALSDDSAGGDTNYDGAASVPRAGDWAGVAVQGTGQFFSNDFTELRYTTATHSGTLVASQAWLASNLHRVTGDVTVPDTVTLTINPGTVVKFEAGRSLVVNSGGNLSALGSLAEPIVFTSIRDDSAGGDTNGDGNASAPAAGDWACLYFHGGQGDLGHARLNYAGGPTGGDGASSAALRVDSSSRLTLANSVIRDPFWGGVWAGAGNVALSNCVVTGADRAVSAFDGATVAIVGSVLDANNVGLWWHGGTFLVSTSIITNSAQFGVPNGGTAVSVRYCDVWPRRAGDAIVPGTDGNLALDPRFKDPAREDYRLDYRSPCIDAGDGSVAAATDLTGAPRYNDPRTPDTGVPMPGPAGAAAVPDLGAYEFVETAVSAIDLTVAAVVGPLAATAGETVTVRWTVTNLGSVAATGPWHDRVYLVRDPDTAPVALLAAEVLVGQGVHLGPGQSTALSAQVRVPGSTITPHRWQVSVNGRGEIFEGANTANNTAVSAQPVALALPSLALDGTTVTGQFAVVGEAHWFSFTPEPGQDILLTLNLADPAGAVELYIGAGYVPSPQHFDSRQTEWNAPVVTALAVDTSAPTYYVLAYDRSLSGGSADFTLSAAVLGFQLDSVAPSTVGNSGAVTLRLRGGRLTGTTTCQMVDPAGGVRNATAVLVVDASQVYATFDLTGAAAGSYGVRVNAGGNSASLAGAVAVGAGTPGRFEVSVIMPRVARVGRVFTAYVEYANVGQADIAAPLLYIKSRAGALFARDPAAEPALTEDEFLAAGGQGPAGLLRPGERVALPLRVRAITGTTQLDVSYIDVSNTTPMAWAYLADRVNSLQGDDPQLPAVLAALQTRIGSTWGDYVASLAAAANLLPAALGDAKDLNALVQLEYRRVRASLGASISGTVVSSSLRRPLAGLRIGAVTASGPVGTTVGHILNDGSFVLPKLSAGTYLLQVQGADVESTVPATLAVTAGTPLTGVVVAVAPQLLVVGTVRDSAGALVAPGALVTVLAGAVVVGTGLVDGSGAYRVAGLAPGTYTFVVTAAGQAQTEHAAIAVTAGSSRVDLTVAPQAMVSGVAVLPGGAPATGLFVFASLVGSTTPLSLFSAAGAADGSFTLSGLPGAVYDLSFSDFAAGVNAASLPGIVVAAGGHVVLGTVPLLPVAKAAAPAAIHSSAKGITAAGTNDDSQYDPGSTAPLYSALNPAVLGAQEYLLTVWLASAYEGWGVEDAGLWREYLTSTSASHAEKRFYGADSQIVEGSFTPFGSGYRSYDLHDQNETSGVSYIQEAVAQGVQEMFRTGELTCDQLLENRGGRILELTTANFPGLAWVYRGTVSMSRLNLSGYPYTNAQGRPDTVGPQVIYTDAFNISSNTAGGIGVAQPFLTPGSGSGQQYEDNRHWEGVVRVLLAGNGQVTVHYDVDWIVNDTVDFSPGDLGGGIQQCFTLPMNFLETAGQAFDVPFRVRYQDYRFGSQTFAIPQNAPTCPDPDRPPKPGTPGGGGSTPGNESGDPNELVGPAGVGPQGFVLAAQVFPYSIHFENMPTATAPAQQVVVTTVLDPDLDRSTLELVQIRCNDAVIDVPAGLQEYATEVSVGSDPNPVRVSVRFEPASGRITWDLQSVDPLTGLLVEDPLAGFLPPNTAAPAGEGTVSFTVRPQPGLATGTRITGQASIVFDVNAPILTNTALNTLDAGAPVARVTALPAVLPYAEVAVRWSGTDDYGGSGVVAYDLFVATDGGPFTVWLSRSTATSAVFAGERGHSYAFYAVARDAVGNSEVQLTPLAETQTRVPLLADDSDGDGLPDWFEAVIINANRFDALGSFAAVQPWDDFDGDGAVNLHEYQVGTDPIDRLSVPAAVAPSGAFQVVLGAAGVTAGNGLWDLTGVYSVAVAGQPLVMHLVHDSRGRLSGTATYTAAGGAVVPLSVLGTVSGRAGGAVLARIALRGSDVARTASLDLAFTLTLNVGARQLRGPLVGAVRVGGVTTPVAATVALAIPAPMDGTWGLTLQLVPSGRSLSGTALLTLSNGVDYAFQVRGRSAGAAAVLTLTGAAGDPLASGISLRTTITPMLGQRAGLGALSGNGYGQTLRR